MTNYTPLHVHTEKSLMDGVATAEEYAKRAVELGMTSIAVTDHGTMSNHRSFAGIAKEYGLKPILGMEAYISSDIADKRDRKSRTDPLDRLYNHLTILVQNQKGYQNLSKLNEISWNEGYYSKPRIDFELLNQYSEGLVIGSACMGGLLNSAIEAGDFVVAKNHLGTLRDIAGDNFYIELMPHNNDGINTALLELADAYNIKTIVTPDCHHAHKGQKVIQEVMLINSTHPKEVTDLERKEQYAKLKDENRLPDYSSLSDDDRKAMEKFDYIYGPDRPMTFNKFDIHLLSPEEMEHGMGSDFRVESMHNTMEIAESIDTIEFSEGLDLLPHTVEDTAYVLRSKCENKLRNIPQGKDQKYWDRLNEELNVIIDQKHFDPYFLIVEDMVNWAKNQGIPVGPGRGSGAGSLVNYLLGNTRVDPVENHLLFFRFIDPSREDWPDVDIDFGDRRRGEVKEYIADKYGYVASIATYQKFVGKGVVKDVSRVFNVPLSDVNKVNKLIDTWEDFENGSNAEWFRKKYPYVLTYGKQLVGRTRGTGVHASGLVTSRIPLSDVAPIETRSVDGKTRMPVVAVDMEETANIGLIKLDVLGLKALTTIDDTLSLIKSRTGKDIDLYKIDIQDTNVYKMIGDGNTLGIFQCEQTPYTKLLVDIGVNKFEDLASSNALVRPGAMKTIGKEYMLRKTGRKKVTYIHPCTEWFTSDTYGLCIYQEQIMLLCTELAGMTMVDANKVRKITAKKKDASLLAEYREKFINGSAEKIGMEKASSLWEDMLEWSGYGFNKSHAVAYSLVSYWTAWLKYYYPIEFMTATLKNEGDKDSRTQYLIEAKRMGIKIMLPHVNRSGVDFTIENGGIRIGLSSIKYISENVAQQFINNRPFNSYEGLEQFVFTKGNHVNSRSLYALDAVGAANIGDHQNTNIRDNLYEYLNLPEVGASIPNWWRAYMTDVSEFEQSGACVVMGAVTNVRRGTGWSLVTVMDKTGSVGIFDAEDSKLLKGHSYILLVGDNRIVESVDLEGVGNSSANVVKYLNQKESRCAIGEYLIVDFVPRMTKAGKRMGTLIVSDHNHDLMSMVVFPDSFNIAYIKLQPGTRHRIKYDNGKDGGYIFKGVE